MRAALAARVHYMDLGGLYHMTKKQFALDRIFAASANWQSRGWVARQESPT